MSTALEVRETRKETFESFASAIYNLCCRAARTQVTGPHWGFCCCPRFTLPVSLRAVSHQAVPEELQRRREAVSKMQSPVVLKCFY